MTRHDLNIVMTCGACPEQYDVFRKDGTEAGYLRLRGGYFRADAITCGGPPVYEAEPAGDGMFEPWERDLHINAALDAIAKYLEKRNG